MSGGNSCKRNLSINSDSDDSFSVNKPPSKSTKMAAGGSDLDNFEMEGENGEIETAVSNFLSTVKNENSVVGESDLIKLLTAVVIKQQKTIDKLQSDVTDLKCRSMRGNVLVHNLPEKFNLDSEKVLCDYLEKIPGISRSELKFDRVHRMGVEGSKPTNQPRVMVAKCSDYKLKEKIMKMRPQRKYNDDKTVPNDPYITHHFPTEIVEARRELSEYASLQIPISGKKPKISLDVNRLRINGELKRLPVATPSPARLLSLPKEEIVRLRAEYKFGEAKSKTKPSVPGLQIFRCAKELTNMNEIREAYDSFLLNPSVMERSHNALAYTLSNGERGYLDDGDLGLGHTALKGFGKAKVNKAFFLYPDIGPKPMLAKNGLI